MVKRLIPVVLGALVVAGCGTTPATAPEMPAASELSTKSFWGWGGGGSGPTSGVDSYLRQGRSSQLGWGTWNPINWNAYYPNGWVGASPYYLPPVYKTDFGNFSYFAAPIFPSFPFTY